MEAILFVGIQGAGKSTFYRERFFATHVRISLDLLRTRHRERCFLELCLETRQPFVVDNANLSRGERRVYIELARQAGFKVIGYYFQSRVAECQSRNLRRQGDEQVPLQTVLGTAGRLEIPSRDEGFDELHYVRLVEPQGFVIEDWRDEI